MTSTPSRPGATCTAACRESLRGLASPDSESTRAVHTARPGREGVTCSVAVASAPAPGAGTVARASSRPSSSTRTVIAVPRGSPERMRTRTGAASPTRALGEVSTSATARSGPGEAPTTTACTGAPSARAAATGSVPAFTTPSLTTMTPSGRRSTGAAASAASASPRAVDCAGTAAESPSSDAANRRVSTVARPRRAPAISRTARAATSARVGPPGVAGRSMLAEVSSRTVTRRPEAGSTRSSTGCASSHASVTSTAARRTPSTRRSAAGTGGSENR
jgi:hypothetical protein